MAEICWLTRRPQRLTKPLLIAVFDGEDDPARSGFLALTYLREVFQARLIAEVDVEPYVDYEENRPFVTSDDGVGRRLEWPTVNIYRGKDKKARRDIILISFVEPRVGWRRFTALAVETIKTFNPDEVVFLAGQIVHTAHTLPIEVSVRSNAPRLMRELGLMSDHYVGPTTIMGAVQIGLDDAGTPLAIMWSSVPHYLVQTPSPKAAHALVSKLKELFKLAVNPSDFDGAVAEYEETITKIIESDDEVFNYLARIGVAEIEDSASDLSEYVAMDPVGLTTDMVDEAEDYLRQIRRDIE